jgi:archaellum biogenesis ATPase FlaH
MLKGEAVVYLSNDHSPKEVEKELSGRLRVNKFMDAGLLTLRSPHVFWENYDIAPRNQFLNLSKLTKKLFYDLEKSLKISREVMLIVDSFSTQCSMLEGNERVRLLHLLRSLTRRRPVTVLGIVHKKQVPSTMPEVTMSLADAVMDFDIDSLGKVVRYTVDKLPGWHEAPRQGTLEIRGGLLTPSRMRGLNRRQ